MTRINVIPPQYLLDQHLLAEYREMPMVMAALRRSLKSKSWREDKIPPSYIFGKGHVTFFYNKGVWLEDRWWDIIDELKARKFKLNLDGRNVHFRDFKELVNNPWEPDQNDLNLSVARVLIRFHARPGWYKYFGIPIQQHIYTRCLEELSWDQL